MSVWHHLTSYKKITAPLIQETDPQDFWCAIDQGGLALCCWRLPLPVTGQSTRALAWSGGAVSHGGQAGHKAVWCQLCLGAAPLLGTAAKHCDLSQLGPTTAASTGQKQSNAPRGPPAALGRTSGGEITPFGAFPPWAVGRSLAMGSPHSLPVLCLQLSVLLLPTYQGWKPPLGRLCSGRISDRGQSIGLSALDAVHLLLSGGTLLPVFSPCFPEQLSCEGLPVQSKS